ncbi:hypothetical protein WN51_11372, partial [Melipona quadrifasciata]
KGVGYVTKLDVWSRQLQEVRLVKCIIMRDSFVKINTIHQKRPELVRNPKGVVFHQDNARPHTSLGTRQKLLQQDYSQDLSHHQTFARFALSKILQEEKPLIFISSSIWISLLPRKTRTFLKRKVVSKVLCHLLRKKHMNLLANSIRSKDRCMWIYLYFCGIISSNFAVLY